MTANLTITIDTSATTCSQQSKLHRPRPPDATRRRSDNSAVDQEMHRARVVVANLAGNAPGANSPDKTHSREVGERRFAPARHRCWKVRLRIVCAGQDGKPQSRRIKVSFMMAQRPKPSKATCRRADGDHRPDVNECEQGSKQSDAGVGLW